MTYDNLWGVLREQKLPRKEKYVRFIEQAQIIRNNNILLKTEQRVLRSQQLENGKKQQTDLLKKLIASLLQKSETEIWPSASKTPVSSSTASSLSQAKKFTELSFFEDRGERL